MQESTVKDLYPEQRQMRPMVFPSLPASSFLTEMKSVCYLKLAVTFSSLFLFSRLLWDILKCPRHSQVRFEVLYLFRFLISTERTELVLPSTFAQYSSSLSRSAFIRAILMTMRKENILYWMCWMDKPPFYIKKKKKLAMLIFRHLFFFFIRSYRDTILYSICQTESLY